jgi:hypothetical protein
VLHTEDGDGPVIQYASIILEDRQKYRLENIMEQDLWEYHGGDAKTRYQVGFLVAVEYKRMAEVSRGQEYLQVSY